MSLTENTDGYRTLTPLNTILERENIVGTKLPHVVGLNLLNRVCHTIGTRLTPLSYTPKVSIRYRLKVSRSISTTGTPIRKKVWVASSLDSLRQDNTLLDFLTVQGAQYGMRLEAINESGRTLIYTEASQADHNRPALHSSF